MKIINSRKPSTDSGEVDLCLTLDSFPFLCFINNRDKYYMMLTVQNTKYYKSFKYENGYLYSTAYTEFTSYIMFMAESDNAIVVTYKTRR